MGQTIDFILGEVIIYVFSILFILFDIYIITKIVLLFKKKEKVNIDWKFASVNIITFVLTYAILIILYLMIFVPHVFTIAVLSVKQRDALKAAAIVLFVTYFLRYIIFLLTFKYSFFVKDKNKIIFLSHDLLFDQIEKIEDKKVFIIVKYKKESKSKKPASTTKIFFKKSKLSSTLLQKEY